MNISNILIRDQIIFCKCPHGRDIKIFQSRHSTVRDILMDDISLDCQSPLPLSPTISLSSSCTKHLLWIQNNLLGLSGICSSSCSCVSSSCNHSWNSTKQRIVNHHYYKLNLADNDNNAVNEYDAANLNLTEHRVCQLHQLHDLLYEADVVCKYKNSLH